MKSRALLIADSDAEKGCLAESPASELKAGR